MSTKLIVSYKENGKLTTKDIEKIRGFTESNFYLLGAWDASSKYEEFAKEILSLQKFNSKNIHQQRLRGSGPLPDEFDGLVKKKLFKVNNLMNFYKEMKLIFIL